MKRFSLSAYFIIIITLLTTSAFAGPVSHFGMLKACKTSDGKGRLCSEKTGEPVQVVGPSLYWSVGFGTSFYNAETVDWFVDNMQIGLIRAAMAIRYYGDNSNPINNGSSVTLGYYDNKATQKTIIKRVVDAAIINDIYVIVDWHSHNAEDETALATEFFKEMATEYKDIPNIIWEVYNEPVGSDPPQTSKYSSINSYATSVINSIRTAGSNNLVLIGSPRWSQYPAEQASARYGTTSNNAVNDNVAFVFHFYAGSHFKDGNIWSSTESAINNGYAVFGSEWGFTNADGNGGVVSASDWLNFMDGYKISNCNWNVSNVDESSSMFTTKTTSWDKLSIDSLTSSGKNFSTYMSSNKWIDQVPANYPKGNDVTVSVKEGESVTISAEQLGLTGNITGLIQPSVGAATSTSNSITYTSQEGVSQERVRFAYEVSQNGITIQNRVTVNVARAPILIQKNPTNISRKAQTKFRPVNDFYASDPAGLSLSFKEASLSNPSTGVGTVEISDNRDTLIFTPSASMHNVDLQEVTLNYSIQNTAGVSSSGSVVLRLQNFAPTINEGNSFTLGQKPNTEPIGIGITQVNGRDRDGDSIWFVHLYKDPQYPGTLEQVKADSFVYYPDVNKTGKIVLLAVITDGLLESNIGKTNFTLTGSGQDIGDLPAPTEIPGYTPIISKLGNAGNGLSMQRLGFGNISINFAQSGFAKLDVFSLSGKNMGTLLNGYQNAGSSEVSLNALNLQNGIYILRLRQGSQIKTLRIIN